MINFNINKKYFLFLDSVYYTILILIGNLYVRNVIIILLKLIILLIL